MMNLLEKDRTNSMILKACYSRKGNYNDKQSNS